MGIHPSQPRTPQMLVFDQSKDLGVTSHLG